MFVAPFVASPATLLSLMVATFTIPDRRSGSPFRLAPAILLTGVMTTSMTSLGVLWVGNGWFGQRGEYVDAFLGGLVGVGLGVALLPLAADRDSERDTDEAGYERLTDLLRVIGIATNGAIFGAIIGYEAGLASRSGEDDEASAAARRGPALGVAPLVVPGRDGALAGGGLQLLGRF